MKTLQEALSKSMIKKLRKHEFVLTEFTKKDLENGDLLVDSANNDETIWMYLDNEEMQKRINEFKDLDRSDNSALKNNIGFIVSSSKDRYYRNMYGLFRIPINELNASNNSLIYNAKRFTKLIKCGNKYLNNNLTINEIYDMNNFFKDYLQEL